MPDGHTVRACSPICAWVKQAQSKVAGKRVAIEGERTVANQEKWQYCRLGHRQRTWISVHSLAGAWAWGPGLHWHGQDIISCRQINFWSPIRVAADAHSKPSQFQVSVWRRAGPAQLAGAYWGRSESWAAAARSHSRLQLRAWLKFKQDWVLHRIRVVLPVTVHRLCSELTKTGPGPRDSDLTSL